MSLEIPPLSADFDDSYKYSHERKKLIFYNKYLLKYPHIFSHTTLEIHPNHELISKNPNFSALLKHG